MNPPFVQITEVVRIYRSNFKIKTTNKACFVLSCRLRGKSLFLYNGKEHTVNRGDILYIPRGSSYAQESTEEEVVYIHFDACSELAGDIRIFPAADPDRVCALFERCAAEYREKQKHYQYRCLSVFYEILSMADITGLGTGQESRLVEQLRACVEAELTSPQFSIAALCQKTGISRAYCNRLFRERFHQTPICYVNQKRVEKAKRLLQSDHYSNEEIAMLCGFGDVKYFYVVFKKLTGMTTRQYKKGLSEPEKIDGGQQISPAP